MWPFNLDTETAVHLEPTDSFISEEFAIWMDDQLKLLEHEFAGFETPASAKNSLLHGRGK